MPIVTHLRLVEAKVLRPRDGSLGGWGQVLSCLAPGLNLCIDALQHLAACVTTSEEVVRDPAVTHSSHSGMLSCMIAFIQADDVQLYRSQCSLALSFNLPVQADVYASYGARLATHR